MLLGHRYYDRSLGRFLTRDPLGDGNNWYDYAGNNPLKNIDPSGFGVAGDLDDCALELVEEALETASEQGLSANAQALCRKMGWQFAEWFLKQPPAVQAAACLIFNIVESVGNEAQYGPVGGTVAHSEIANLLKGTTFGGGVTVATEASYMGGKAVSGGTTGSIRCDVIVSFSDKAHAIFDYKFGKARLAQSRIDQILGHLPDAWKKTPVFKVPGSKLVIPR